jgi:endonuclease/exonuclease/phosphatase family metal-dependent hydrolase
MCCRAETNSGKIIFLVNVHTSSPLEDMSFSKRSDQIFEVIDDLILLHNKGEKVLAGGDFNCDPYHFKSWGRPKLKEVQERWESTFSDYSSGSLKAVNPGANTWSHTWTLDHIITNMGFSRCKVLDGEERIDLDKHRVSEKNQISFMDHRAVTLKVKIE